MRAWFVAVLAASLLFVAHAEFFAGWLVDDAGISFAYARNLARGEGLVAQPGTEPVEGFTNLSWVLVLAIASLATGSSMATLARGLAVLSVVAGFALLARLLLRSGRRSGLAVTLVLAVSASSTAFVAWSMSGLENAFYVLTIALSVVATIWTADALESGERSAATRALATGTLLFLVATTRPDGVLFLFVPPFVWSVPRAAKTDREDRRASDGEGHSVGSALGAWWLGFALPWSLLTIGRLAYFGDVLPNTYYAKHGPGWAQAHSLLERLGAGLGGAVFLAGTLIGIAIGGGVARRLGLRLAGWRALPITETTLVCYSLVSALVLVALPSDWMPELRFGTPLLFLVPATVVTLMERGAGHQVATIAAALLLAGSVAYSSIHTPRFVSSPALPLSAIERLARDLDAASTAAGLDRPRILLPDIGGALWEDRFEVVDLAGLVDRSIALEGRRNLSAFRTDVIESRPPDLIWTHGYWSRTFDWEQMPGFGERYVRAWAEPGDPADAPRAALYLRRDHAASAERVAEAFRLARAGE